MSITFRMLFNGRRDSLVNSISLNNGLITKLRDKQVLTERQCADIQVSTFQFCQVQPQFFKNTFFTPMLGYVWPCQAYSKLYTLQSLLEILSNELKPVAEQDCICA